MEKTAENMTGSGTGLVVYKHGTLRSDVVSEKKAGIGRYKNTLADTQSVELTDREVREKLVARGVESLADSELLSIILNDGAGAASALELAQRVLEYSDGSLTALSKAGLRKLRMVEGIGVKRAAVIAASLELGRRYAIEVAAAPVVIESNEDIINMFRPQMAGINHEEFWVVYLSSANSVLDKSKVSQGGVSGTTVDHKLIVKRAVELLASAVILVHNHPSGIARPSEEDKLLTNRIVTASSLFDIIVLDHIIITPGECFSFRGAKLVF